MGRNIMLCVFSIVALLLMPFLVHLRDGVANAVAISKYKELLASSAIVENPTTVAAITGRANDWTAVPHFLFDRSGSIDIAMVAMLLPILASFAISVWNLLVELRARKGNLASRSEMSGV
jgi:hypothetical protein